MPVVVSRSILVEAPVSTVFDISNRIELWPKMVPEYVAAEILGREGRKIWFRLTDDAGRSWVSWRMLYPPYLIYAERHEPKAPFEFNQITWAYHALPGDQTLMTWDMCFELATDRRDDSDQVRQRMLAHVEANQTGMRDFIQAQHAR